MGITLEIIVPQDLMPVLQVHCEQKGLSFDNYNVFSEENHDEIDYIITLGGDGTLLWATKQFNRGAVPPLITFSQGSLGFMCNFTFEDHDAVLTPMFTAVKQGFAPAEIGLEHRLRLKVNAGPNTAMHKELFRGDQLSIHEPIELKDIHVVNEVVIDRGPSPYTV